MIQSNWVYHLITPAILLLIWALFGAVSIFAHISGVKAQKNKSLNFTDIVPVNILGLLALILGFTFSMAISRDERRRELVIKESNAIESAYIRSSLLRGIPSYDIKNLYRAYLDSRIAYYENYDSGPSLRASAVLRKNIWSHFIEITKTDRTDIAGEYDQAIKEMFESANARNYAIQVKLPTSIYIMILLISCTALYFLNFDSGYKNEKAYWRPATLVLLLGFVIILIFDIDHPRVGTIEISQKSLILLRKSM